MTFSCEHRADLLTEALRFQPQFPEKNRETLVCIADCVSIIACMEGQPTGVWVPQILQFNFEPCHICMPVVQLFHSRFQQPVVL